MPSTCHKYIDFEVSVRARAICHKFSLIIAGWRQLAAMFFSLLFMLHEHGQWTNTFINTTRGNVIGHWQFECSKCYKLVPVSIEYTNTCICICDEKNDSKLRIRTTFPTRSLSSRRHSHRHSVGCMCLVMQNNTHIDTPHSSYVKRNVRVKWALERCSNAISNSCLFFSRKS